MLYTITYRLRNGEVWDMTDTWNECMRILSATLNVAEIIDWK